MLHDMRVLQGKSQRQKRLERRRRHGASCTLVRYGACVAVTRPHTRDYSPEARQRLGLAVQRAREAMGPHPYRPSFANLIGKSVRSLVKLEAGDPVGPTVYEAAADHLPGWTRDTPKAILEGGEAPPLQDAPADDEAPVSAARQRIIEMTEVEIAERIVEMAELRGVEAAGELLRSINQIRSEARQRT